MTLRVLDLFSGIGAFSLGLERSGMRTVAFCEIDAYCRRVLAKHWPEVPRYDDVRSLTAAGLRADGIEPDVICGGFPCQDISVAGKGAGIDGERSGLWSEFARLIGEIRPRHVIVENVAALVVRGLDRVLGDLAALGYDAEWRIISAADMGAPHRRERIWIVAYPDSGCGAGPHDEIRAGGRLAGAIGEAVAYPARVQPGRQEQRAERERTGPGGQSVAVADAGRLTPARHRGSIGETGQSDWWRVEPDVGRVAHGVASRVDRLRSLGNALVPQIPEMIGRAILVGEP